MGLFDIINAATSATGAAVGAASFASAVSGRKKQREFEREMYERQLADNRKNWELENMYNSPEAQMLRLKKAGLNPQLVYGKGADAMGGSIDSANPNVSDQSLTLSRGFNDLMGGLNSIYDLRIKDAQANLINQKSSTEVTIQWVNQATAMLKELEEQKGQLEYLIGRNTYRDIVKQIGIITQQKVADLANTRADTGLKTTTKENVRANTTGKNIQNEMDQQQLDMYKQLGLPPQMIDQILKTAPFLAPFFNMFKGKK